MLEVCCCKTYESHCQNLVKIPVAEDHFSQFQLNPRWPNLKPSWESEISKIKIVNFFPIKIQSPVVEISKHDPAFLGSGWMQL